MYSKHTSRVGVCLLVFEKVGNECEEIDTSYSGNLAVDLVCWNRCLFTGTEHYRGKYGLCRAGRGDCDRSRSGEYGDDRGEWKGHGRESDDRRDNEK